MNTEITFWTKPLAMNHEIYDGEPLYLKWTVKGEVNAEEHLDNNFDVVMDFLDIDQNFDFQLESFSFTNQEPFLEFIDSPQEKKLRLALVKKENKINNRIQKFLKGDLTVTKKNVIIKKNGEILVNLPQIEKKFEINFPKVWEQLEKYVIGKITENDEVVIKNNDGDVVLELRGQGCLNVGLADLKVFNGKVDNSFFGENQTGGLFLRDNGSLQIGDIDRTFYLDINVNNLVKTALQEKTETLMLPEVKL